MKRHAIAVGAGLSAMLAAVAWGQVPGTPKSPTAPTAQSAVVETAAIGWTPPEQFAVPIVLEPYRRLSFRATADGIVRSLSVTVGAEVRDGQEIAQMDRAESLARHKIAEANVAEVQAGLDAIPAGDARLRAIEKARLDAAKGRLELTQIDFDRCMIRAPFSGRIMNLAVVPGQFVARGEVLAELADAAIVKVLVPIDAPAREGDTIELQVEGKPVSGKIQTILPLPDAFAVLRELDLPWSSAWVHLDNPKKAYEPGQRVRGPADVAEPVVLIPSRAVRGGTVQVVRNGKVVDLAVKPRGEAEFDRVRVSGPFLASDSAVVQSSVPLVAGTIIRFQGDPPISGAANAIPFGTAADLNPSAGPRPSPASKPKVKTPGKTAGGSVPF